MQWQWQQRRDVRCAQELEPVQGPRKRVTTEDKDPGPFIHPFYHSVSSRAVRSFPARSGSLGKCMTVPVIGSVCVVVTLKSVKLSSVVVAREATVPVPDTAAAAGIGIGRVIAGVGTGMGTELCACACAGW